MKFRPRIWQQASIDLACKALEDKVPRTMYSAPTGVGKSVVEAGVHRRRTGSLLISPREEILSGIIDKGADPDRCSTPIKLRNLLMQGSIPYPQELIVDEAHHAEAETYKLLELLTGMCPMIGYTATPYRGTPKSSKALRDAWGEPVQLITYAEACAEGYISMPEYEMLPLVDDDFVDVGAAGDFSVTSVDSVTLDRLGDMAEHSRRWYDGLWDRPTLYTLPSSACCKRLQEELHERGMPSAVVNAATPRDERYTAFDLCVRRVAALLHIAIVGEGVDLPIRRMVDIAPTLSPVLFVQRLGRATRPVADGEDPPHYVCTNRNLLRHAYALEGVVRIGDVVAADRAFGPTDRAHVRALGLESIGRFKPTSVRMRDGLTVHMYCLSVPVNGAVVEYVTLVHPVCAPVWATKVRTRKPDGSMDWGTWRLTDPPADMRGFASVGAKSLSPKQEKFWSNCAHMYGIDADQKVDRKNFQILPVLKDTGARFG